ncbi:MAG: amino acid ABC transporter substrate-binding protein [Pseudomonadota bacterium]
MHRSILARLIPLLPLAALALGGMTAPAAAGPVYDRVVERGVLNIGIRTDTPPFAYVQDGAPRGFTAELCGMMAGAILATSDLEVLDAKVIPVTAENRFDALKSGEIDLLCGATTANLTRRETMSFTIPTFSTGIGALVAADAPALLLELINGGPAALSANATREGLKGKTLGFQTGTTAETWVAEKVMPQLEGAVLMPVDNHVKGIESVADGTIDLYFADKAILSGLLRGLDNAEGFAVSRATFTSEPYALAIPRGDEDLRLVMDRALSHIYRSGAIYRLYERYFGKPGTIERVFYSAVALPE